MIYEAFSHEEIEEVQVLRPLASVERWFGLADLLPQGRSHP